MGADIGALVVPERVLDAEQQAVRIDRRADAVALLARVVGGKQVLPAVLDPLDRPAEPQRRQADQVVLGVELAAHPEPAPDMALVELHRRRGAAERPGELVAVEMRPLGSPMELQDVARAIEPGDSAPGLHRHGRMTADPKVELDHRVGPGEGAPGIAPALAQHMGLGVMAGIERPGRLIGGEDRRQVLDRGKDLLGGILGAIGVIGEDRRHRLADIAHNPARQDRLAIGLQAAHPGGAELDRPDLGDIGRGPHRRDPGRAKGCLRVDRGDPAMRAVRAHDSHMELVGKRDVGRKPAPPGDQRRVFKPPDPLADERLGPALGHCRPPFISAAAALTAFRMFT